jgi:hypothetical protein
MKRAAVPGLFLITLMIGLNPAEPAARAFEDHPVTGEKSGLLRQEHGECGKGQPRKLGTLQVGPSASGDALRILSTAYQFRPLAHQRCRSCLGVVVGREDLSNPAIVVQLRAAYEAGHGVAVSNATPLTIDRLHDLLGHQGSVHPPKGLAKADLVGFRKASRSGGQLHSISHMLIPRATCRKNAALSKSERLRAQRVADAHDIEALQRLFSAKALVPASEPRASASTGSQNLLDLKSESYESGGTQSDEYANQVQVINTIWAARSFNTGSSGSPFTDYYYVNQEIDYRVNEGAGSLKSWNNSATSSIPYSGVILLTPSPQTTLEATEVTSGVSTSIGTSVGFSTTKGFDASVSETTTISHSNQTTVPPISIINDANLGDASTNWTYTVNDLATGGTLDLYNNWIWQVPSTAYDGSTPGALVVNMAAYLNAEITGLGFAAVENNFSTEVPWPFGETFQIQPPVVTAVKPGCVDSGDVFSIQGTGLYPSLLNSVLVNGVPVSPQAITPISDTQVNVAAPSTVECHFGCPVQVSTAKASSNTNASIEISAFCGGG